MSYIFSVPPRCKEPGCEGVDGTHLAQDTDKCWTGLNTVENIWFRKQEEIDYVRNC